MPLITVTDSELDTIVQALEEFYDSEKSFLKVQIVDDPNDTNTIIETSVNLHNVKKLREKITRKKDELSKAGADHVEVGYIPF